MASFFYFMFLGQRTWVVGDSIVCRAAKLGRHLPGGGTMLWKGLSGAKCVAVENRILRFLRVEHHPVPTTLIMHLGTNDIFHASTTDIRERVKKNLDGIRRLLPNTRLIWSDILVRLEYSEQKRKGAGKRNMRSINKRAHKVMREELEGCNKVVVHSHIFQSKRKYYKGKKLFEYDCTHPTVWGLECMRKTWSDALVHFNAFPQAFDFPPGSIRLQ